MITIFEKYNSDKYVILAEHQTGTIVSVERKSSLQNNPYSFHNINDLDDCKVVYYTSLEVDVALTYLNDYYKDYIFKSIPSDELDLLIKTTQYNL